MKLFVKKSLKKGLHCHKCNNKMGKRRIVEGSPRALYCSVCDLAYVNYSFYKQEKYPDIEVKNAAEVQRMSDYFVKDQLERKQVQEILKTDFSDKEIEENRKKLVAKNPNRVRRPSATAKPTEKFEKTEYKVQKYPDITIKVYKSNFNVKVALWIKTSFFNNRRKNEPVHIKDSRTDITFSIGNSKEALNRLYRKTDSGLEFYVLESMYTPFPEEVNMSGEYVDLPDFVRISKCRNYGSRIDAYINKRFYVPQGANASYETMQKYRRLEGKGPSTGYVSNRNKANFEHSNIANPFQGGRVNPR